jgi:hypothetical protein
MNVSLTITCNSRGLNISRLQDGSADNLVLGTQNENAKIEGKPAKIWNKMSTVIDT